MYEPSVLSSELLQPEVKDARGELRGDFGAPKTGNRFFFSDGEQLELAGLPSLFNKQQGDVLRPAGLSHNSG